MASEPNRIQWKDTSPQPNENQAAPSAAAPRQNQTHNTGVLGQVGRDLTDLARRGLLSPLFGRQKELTQLQRILLRKQKSNPMLLGAPGVGKTALVEGLAALIVNGKTAQDLRDKRIIEIIPSMLTAGTQYRGSFEERMQAIMREAAADPSIILFIDEIHTIINAGAVGGGSLDAANILKPALARGEIRCIGSTTSDEYDQIIKSDPAFERRFDPLHLEEPTESEAVEIIRASIPAYQNHHHIQIDYDAVEAAVRLSVKHILDRRLPDKAFDLLDSACTTVRLPSAGGEAASENPGVVSADTIAAALAEKMNIPVDRLDADFKDKLQDIETSLNSCIIGQPIAINRVASAVINGYAGLNDPNKAKYVFGFFGSSGIGKTAMAKALAKFLFDSPDSLIRLDMSEYQEKISVTRLLGSPPGYVGYDDEGTFATRLRRQPYSVVLLDEIEKAHPDVHETFLHIFDEGRFTDARGRLIEARQAIFILTSNLFTVKDVRSVEEYEANSQMIRTQLTSYFRPEFINRMDEIVLFRELGLDDLKKIAEIEINELSARESQLQLDLVVGAGVLDWIAETALDPNSGARAVERIVKKEIAEPIANLFINGSIQPKQKLIIDIIDNKIQVKAAQ